MVTITAELSDNQTYSVPTFGSTGGGGGTEPPPGGGGGTGSEVDPNGTIIEAELYDVLGSNFDVRSDMSSASGDYLYATTNSTTSPSGSPVEYSLYFTETGTYFIDFLMNDNGSGGDNSLWYGVDGSLVGNVTSPGSNTNWNWANTPHSTGPNPSSITINSVGLHTVLIWARENGMRLDQFRLTREGGSSGGGGGSTNDSITITRADYSSRRDRVTIYAENSLGNDAQLTVNYNGDSYQMTWDSGDNRWELRISTSSCRDDQIEVTSSEGGNDTAYVSGCSN